ncbi:hypothetical protein FANTH_6909 [Fusarium anthophilum]|uniref:Uncharacterized protein n=1 Tax=Fusarium anthophilum TaxID=48485 RepID=A0A8H5E439_9HYPO|nr:hypothetical protein FANTH_6909 [Fusarium anthophilum]
MVKVEDEDPFPEEPEEPLTAEEARDACLKREAALKGELTTCKKESAGGTADSTLAKELIASSCPGQHNKYGTIGGKEYKFWCHRYHNLNNVKETHQKINTMLDCVKLCNARSWCKHVVHGVYETNCRLYAWAVSHATVPGLDSLPLNAAVLKW